MNRRQGRSTRSWSFAAGGVSAAVALLAGCLALLTGCLALLTGCTVPRDAEARRISAEAIPKSLQDQVYPRNVYLIRGSRLTPVKKPVPLSLSVETTLADLIGELRKPRTADEQKIYSSSIALQNYDVSVMSVQGNLVTLDITKAVGIEDDPYALGQLVLTLTDVQGIERVDFERNGQRLTQVRSGYNFDDDPFSPTPVRKETFLQPVVLTPAKLFYVANGGLWVFDSEFDGGDPSDTALYTAVQYLAALSRLDKVPRGYRTLLPSLDATIRDDGSGSFVLSFGAAYNELSSTDQALAIGQIVQSLSVSQIPQLPTIQLEVAGNLIGTIDLTSYAHLVKSVVSDTADSVVSETADSVVANSVVGDSVARSETNAGATKAGVTKAGNKKPADTNTVPST